MPGRNREDYTMNKIIDFIGSSIFGGWLAWTAGYGWSLLSDVNVANAVLMLSGMALWTIGMITGAIAGAVWCWRHVHVRITIV